MGKPENKRSSEINSNSKTAMRKNTSLKLFPPQLRRAQSLFSDSFTSENKVKILNRADTNLNLELFKTNPSGHKSKTSLSRKVILL